jgi:hypothetical protein
VNTFVIGTILDPVYASSKSNQIVGYTCCGDSALWTVVYIDAEAFQYKVTRSADAINNVKSALAGLKAVGDVTGNNRLAHLTGPRLSLCRHRVKKRTIQINARCAIDDERGGRARCLAVLEK